ncbi:hypothetical protein Asulf_01205 [Archaeoglobus sulfaticallidus PM70-1]|uniref:Threonine efflux protein n=1 Tax=Archaeoglobus sulfaticallidus PM70-1 TaxID=387631 RepID=N0BDW7_9EURY|nr:LysE family transporter [Archaeoglobus sulfaticallidus]AGK61203.1 hypothetical protein Asulf_01205 [Archaeoglobus sulfaticallidus PM70-1]
MNLAEFALMVFFISLSGVMAPGPLFASAVSEGMNKKYAGFLLSSGHAIVEIPIILILFFFGVSIITEQVKVFVGVFGGIFLIYMAHKELTSKSKLDGSTDMRSIFTGLAMSIANPYFIIWWFTIGLILVTTAEKFGIMGLIVFIIVHELCDFGWLGFVSLISSKTVEVWDKSAKTLSTISAIIFVIFGIYFIYSGISTIV